MGYKQLTLEKRCELYAYLKLGHSKNKISKSLGVHKSTVYRELKRNTGLRGCRPKLRNKAVAKVHENIAVLPSHSKNVLKAS